MSSVISSGAMDGLQTLHGFGDVGNGKLVMTVTLMSTLYISWWTIPIEAASEVYDFVEIANLLR